MDNIKYLFNLFEFIPEFGMIAVLLFSIKNDVDLSTQSGFFKK